MAKIDLTEETGRGGAGRFSSTHWSVVLLAGEEGTPQAAEALEELCRAYWYPLYAYVRRRGYPTEEAKDLTQGFFAYLLDKKYVAYADRQKGRFRSYLLKALNHYLTNEWNWEHAAKRGGGRPVISLDDGTAENRYRLELVSDLSPDRIYERRWAQTLLDRALVQLRAESTAAGNASQFNVLKEYLPKKAGEGSHAQAAAKLGMSPDAVGVAVHRLRHRYRELICEEIAHTVASPAEAEDELRWLLVVLS